MHSERVYNAAELALQDEPRATAEDVADLAQMIHDVIGQFMDYELPDRIRERTDPVRVGFDAVAGAAISTVRLDDGTYETLVFTTPVFGEKPLARHVYATRQEALDGHAAALMSVRTSFAGLPTDDAS